jgi:molybdopterin converting factor small subunit
MSQALRTLQTAVREFVNRPTEEEVDANELRDVVEELDGELEKLYESPEERAAQDEALARAIEEISATYGSRG